MGIKNLHKFLRKHCPEIYVETHISAYAYQKVAIDISLYLFKYKTIFGDRWLDAFINLICCLRRNEIHCVFIYDGPSPPEKDKEKASRKASRDKLVEKINLIEDAIDLYYQTNEVTEVLQKISDKKGTDKLKSLLRKADTFDIKVCERYLAKIKTQNVHLTYTDFQNTKKLFNILGVPYFTAKTEGETMCSQLALNGKVVTVLSEDTDVLAYGTPIFLTKINTSTDMCVEITLQDILTAIDFTYEQFRDLCIMCGTDYNSNIFRIGPEKSYQLLKKHESIDKLLLDTSILNHVRGRELFGRDKEVDLYVPYCKPPDFEKLKGFLFVHNCRINLNTIKDAFQAKELVFD